MTDYLKKGNNDFKVTDKNNPCPVCGDTTKQCRTHQNREFWLCSTYGHAQKFDRIGEYKVVAITDRWANCIIEKGEQTQAQKEEQENRLAIAKALNKKREKERRDNALPLDVLDQSIRQLSNWFGLAPDHESDLLRRGLTAEQIKKGLYFTVEKAAATPAGLPATSPGVKEGKLAIAARGYACVAFKEEQAIGYQIRLDGQTKNKYRWASGTCSSHLKNGELPLSYLPVPGVQSLYLMEGLNKCLIAHFKHGIATVGASGGNFAGCPEQLSEIVGSLQKETQIIIVPDSGAIANPDVRRAIAKTVDLLRQLGKDPVFLWWNQIEKTDPDIDELTGLSETNIIRELPGMSETTSEQKKVRDTKRPAEAPVSVDHADHPEGNFAKIIQKQGLEINNCATNRTFDAWICEEILKDDYVVLAGEFYKWQEDKGFWEKQDSAKIKHLIARASDRAYKLEFSKDFGWQALPRHKKESKAFNFARDYFSEFRQDLSRHLRTFRNGTLNLVTKELSPKRKEDLVTSFIDCDYVPDQEVPAVFADFITSSFGSDQLERIRAVTAMLLDPTSPWEKFPYLIGASGGGKSTLGQVWGNLFESGYGAGDFDTFSKPESRHYLSGLSLYGIPDVKGRLSGQAMTSFYKIVSNEPVEARPLYQGAYTQTFFTRTWVASVNPLSIEEQDDGWRRRALIIPVLNNPNRTKDPYLKEKLKSAIAGIISWAIAMPKKERDDLLLKHNDNPLAVEIQHTSTLMGDSVKAFVDACLKPSASPKTTDSWDLHLSYLSFCRENIDKNSTMGYQKFISRLKTTLQNNYVDRKFVRENGERVAIPAHWRNLDFNPNVFSVDSTGINAAFTCVRKHCKEGGLDAIAHFWLRPPEPDPEPVLLPVEPLVEAELIADMEPIADMADIADIEDIAEIAEIELLTELEPIADIEDADMKDIADNSSRLYRQDKELIESYAQDCLRLQDKESFELQYGLANFRARTPQAIALLRQVAEAVKETKPDLSETLSAAAVRCEDWSTQIENTLPQKESKPPLTSLERLARARNKKEAKKGSKNGSKNGGKTNGSN